MKKRTRKPRAQKERTQKLRNRSELEVPQLARWEKPLFSPVDLAALAYFRIAFGLIMAASLLLKIYSGYAKEHYVSPIYHSKYIFFEWIQSPPLVGMFGVFAILVVFSILIALGLFYRLATIGFTVFFVYLFLFDACYYLNHDYLICLLGGALTFLPCHHMWSLDVRRKPSLQNDLAPSWGLWLLRFLIGLPYVFGGISKLNGDWLRGQPMRSWLPESPIPEVFGPMGESLPAALFFSWGGLFFDLLVVPALLFRRTRMLATCAALFFHFSNAFIFDIGVFPWLMIAAIFIYYPPDWSRQLLASATRPELKEAASQDVSVTMSTTGEIKIPPRRLRRVIAGALGLLILLQIVLPFRHFLYPGDASWTEEGHRFAWRMMLRDKNTILQLMKKDSSGITPVDLTRWLTRAQAEEIGTNPELLRQFACYLANELREQGETNFSLHGIVVSSLNGRKPQLLVDPRVDLSQEPATLLPKQWLIPLEQPFLEEPWDIPVSQWKEHVDRSLLQEI